MKPYCDDGQVTLYHGDCRDMLSLLDPTSVDLLLTDPPYGVGERTSRRSAGRGGGGWQSRDFPAVHGDDEEFDPIPLTAFPRLVLFGANHYANRLPASASWLVWDKLDGLTSKRAFGFNDNADAELIWTNLGGPVRIIPHRWTGLLRASEINERRVHPTQKPVALMVWIVSQFTKSGDLVLDPYMGSGPIAKACQMTGRRYIGIEIVERYCEEAARRLQQAVLPLGAV
jgi:site-specific DNA-methyltransferase (adenine-specific)/modification methylase